MLKGHREKKGVRTDGRGLGRKRQGKSSYRDQGRPKSLGETWWPTSKSQGVDGN